MVKLSAMGLKILHNSVSFWDEIWRKWRRLAREIFWKLDIGLDWVVVGDMIYFALLL